MLPIKLAKPGFWLLIEFIAAEANCFINSGFCCIICSIPGNDVLNKVLLKWNINALPPNINNNLISGGTLALSLYFSCNSSNTSS